MQGRLVIKLNELLSFVIGAVGLGLVAYPNNSVYLVSWLGGAATQVVWLGLVLVAIAVYLFEWPPRLLNRAMF